MEYHSVVRRKRIPTGWYDIPILHPSSCRVKKAQTCPQNAVQGMRFGLYQPENIPLKNEQQLLTPLFVFNYTFPTVADRFSTFPRDSTHIRDLSQKYVCRATIKLNVIFVFLFPFFSVFVPFFYNSFPSALI